MPFNIVCPSSRGLSLALSRQLLRTSQLPLIATARNDLSEVKERILSGLEGVSEERVTVLKVDVTDEDSIVSAAFSIRSHYPADHARYIFSTAGVLHPERSPSDLDLSNIRATLSTNLLGPLLVLKHFSQFLPQKRASGVDSPSIWCNMSARVGSISDNSLGGWYSYRATKAGLNSITKTFDLHLQRVSGDKAMCVALHPGTMKTNLSREFWNSTKPEKLFSPASAAQRMLEVVTGLRVNQRGQLWDWKGEKVEW
ncbi:hypothetical protein RUND412_003452 [Rhizina undulata]